MELLKLKPIKIKKSGFEDSFFFIAVIFAIAIFIVIMNKAWVSMKDPLADGLQNSLPAGSGVNVSASFDKVTSTTVLFDKLLPFIIIGLFSFVFIGAAMYMNHPVMIIVGIIILGVSVMLAAIYANIYNEITSTDEFSSSNSSFPISNLFMKFLPFILVLVFIGITVAVIWSRGGSANTL